MKKDGFLAFVIGIEPTADRLGGGSSILLRYTNILLNQIFHSQIIIYLLQKICNRSCIKLVISFSIPKRQKSKPFAKKQKTCLRGGEGGICEEQSDGIAQASRYFNDTDFVATNKALPK